MLSFPVALVRFRPVAVVLAFRIAIALTPTAYRIVKWEQQASGQPGGGQLAKWLWDRLHDNSESDAALSTATSDAIGYAADVATYTGSFEVRKVQVVVGFAPASQPVEDDRTFSIHLIKLASGSPTPDWVAADFTAAENALDAFWTSLKTQISVSYFLKQYRWYKAGPAIVPPQEPVRVGDRNVPGAIAVATGTPLPPQVACSVTEKTASRKAWGRFYIPGLTHFFYSTASGRAATTNLSDMADRCDVMYEAFRTAGIPAVVYSAAKPERPKKPSGTLPAIGARALTVDQIQVDDIPDVIRSRRHSTPTLRVQRAIG